ncbi:MAG: NUDIX domain-containing protein [Streptomyces sp.]|nr:NUDIX domain-containing protein [Streptomyces sp.]
MTSWPRRVGCLWLILDAQGRLLIVEPVHKPGQFQLVGGSAEMDEPPHVAAVREGREEIGLTMVPHTLLCLDYAPANPTRGSTEGYNLVYFHRLQADEAINLNAGTPAGETPELLSYRLLYPEQLDKFCQPYQVRRIRAALAALDDAQERGYLFVGRPVTAA